MMLLLMVMLMLMLMLMIVTIVVVDIDFFFWLVGGGEMFTMQSIEMFVCVCGWEMQWVCGGSKV